MLRLDGALLVGKQLSVAAVALALAAGCGDEKDKDPNAGHCVATGLAPQAEQAVLDTWNDRLTYTLEPAQAGSFDKIYLHSYNNADTAATAPGRYELTGSTYAPAASA